VGLGGGHRNNGPHGVDYELLCILPDFLEFDSEFNVRPSPHPELERTALMLLGIDVTVHGAGYPQSLTRASSMAVAMRPIGPPYIALGWCRLVQASGPSAVAAS